MSFGKVSVIIPAYNAEATIAEALKAVLEQSIENAPELVLVDDGSTDATARIARAFPGVRYFYQNNSGPASARNYGAAQASGDVLLFIDSDCRPEAGWLKKMLAGFNASRVGAVAGSYGIANPRSALARIIHAEIRYRHLRLMPEYPRAFGSYNFAITAELFRQLGGFNESYRRASGEDNDLSYRVLRSGARIRFITDACVAHYHQESLGKYLREQFRHGFWRVRTYLDHTAMAAGDDYTFWKDIAEVPLVAVLAGGLFWPAFFWWWLGGFLCFELAAGLWIIGLSSDGLLAGPIMWLRAFSRTAGLLSGGAYFLKKRFY
ncbi:MAG: glycosyltransferase [Candidatus Omnitrophica bacterium]|nr:glycosyltransferase [Candidatus Omnitrophota bacterium]